MLKLKRSMAFSYLAMVKPFPGRGMEKESLRIRPRSRKELRMTHTKGYRVVSAQKVRTA